MSCTQGVDDRDWLLDEDSEVLEKASKEAAVEAWALVWVCFAVGVVAGAGVCAFLRAWLWARSLVHLGVGLGFGACAGLWA